VGTKGFLSKRRCLAIGFLGMMGISTKSMADTSICAAHHVDTIGVNNYNFPTSATIAEEPNPFDENGASDAPISPEWTKKQCRKALEHNVKTCKASPRNLQLPCIAAAIILYRRCLKNAK
jgi:hypothetical protein